MHRLLKIKDIDEFAAILGESSEGVSDILYLFNLLRSYGIIDWVQFDASVVRGLAYYTGIVFEGFDRKGELRAICGGGRYDNLMATMTGGEQSIPAVGFGFGDAVIMELLKSRSLLPTLETTVSNVDAIVYAMEDSLRNKSIEICNELRDKGLRIDLIMDTNRKPKWVFQRADRLNVPLVLMLAQEEHQEGKVILRNMKMRDQNLISYSDIITTVKQFNELSLLSQNK